MTTRTKTLNTEGDTAQDLDEIEDREDNLLANLSDEQQFGVDLHKIQQATIEPGLMRLPVVLVEPSDNGEKLAIELEHPCEKNPRFYLTAPKMWDKDEEELPMLMDWYGYSTRNYHKLQTDRLYVRHEAEADHSIEAGPNQDWEIVPPPNWDWPLRERAERWLSKKMSPLAKLTAPTVLYFVGQLLGLLALLIFGLPSAVGTGWLVVGFMAFSLWLYFVTEAFKDTF